MPCYTDPPTDAELAASRLRELLNEAKGHKFDHKHFQSMIDPGCNVQKYTRKLCAWAKQNKKRIPTMSLEFQLWWRDHQEEDARHEREDLAAQQKEVVRQQGLAKLTQEERKALGIY